MANNVLKTLTIDNISLDVPNAGENLELDADNNLKIKSSPDLKGIPTAPTNTTYKTSNTQIATTEFTQGAINRRLPKQVIWGSKTNISIPNNTETELLSLELPSGNKTVIIKATVIFATNASGRRWMRIKRGTDNLGVSQVQPCSTGYTIFSAQSIAKGDTTTLSLVAAQTSGGALNVIDCTMNVYYILD